MELVLIKPESPEWDFMWKWLEEHPLNKGIENPSIAEYEGQTWQYMGSYKHMDKLIHTFRHRIHPTTNSIQTVSVNNSEAFTPDQIHNQYKL